MTPLISRNLLHVQPQEIGKIKLGGRGAARKTSGGGESYIPQRYDHFVVTTMQREGGKGAFLRDEAVHKVVGDEPTELEAMLMFPEVEQNLMTSMRVYKGRKPSIICDGDVQRNAQGKEEPCARALGQECECRPYCRLQLQLMASPHTGGYYVFRTRSWQTTNNIQTFLEELHARFGTCFQAPVKLMMYQSEDQYSVDGKEQVGRSWKVAMVLNMDYETAALHMVGAKERLDVVRERLMLTAGAVQDDLDARDEEEAGELADEFDPPKGVEASIKTQERLDEVVAGLEPIVPPDPHSASQDAEYEIISDTRREVEGLWQEAEGLKLLDRTARQFIRDALASGDDESLDKAKRALQRLLTKHRLEG